MGSIADWWRILRKRKHNQRRGLGFKDILAEISAIGQNRRQPPHAYPDLCTLTVPTLLPLCGHL